MQTDEVISRRELKQLMKRSDRPGLIRLAAWAVVLGSTGSLIWAAGRDPWLLVPAMFLHGIVMVHLFALQHECSHYSAFRSRWLCRLLARVCGFLLIIPPLFFRYEHCDHHTFTNQPGRDPELIAVPASLWHYLAYLSALPYWRGQIGGLLRRATGRLSAVEKRFIPRVEQGAIVRESRLMIAGYLAVAAAMAGFQWTAPVFYWFLPLLLGEPVMRFVRMTEHVGRPQVADIATNTRCNLVSAPWRFLAWNMNYHAEHHFAPSVPFHALPALHARLRAHLYVENKGYLGAHREILGQLCAARRDERQGSVP